MSKTPSEILFAEKLKYYNIVFEQDYKVVMTGGKFYTVDFYLKAKNLIIEIDGSVHDTPDMVEKDLTRDMYLQGRGFKVLRILNHRVDEYPTRLLKILPNVI